MSRRDLLRHLREHDRQFVRERREHSIWENPVTNSRTSVPRHREIPRYIAERICKQLGINLPS